VLAAAALLLAAAPQARGDKYWSVASGNWSLAANWGGALPTFTDNAYIINGGTATIAASVAVCQNLYLGDPNSVNTGTLQMSGGNLSAFYSEYVGNNGAGTFTQSGGMNSLSVNSNNTGALF